LRPEWRDGPIPFTWEDLAEDMWTHIDALTQEPIDIAGMSFGGVVAMLMAYQQPTRVGQLFLVSTSNLKTAFGVRINTLIQGLIARVPPEEFGALMTTLTFSQDFHDQHPSLRSLRQEGIACDPGTGEGFEGRYRPAFVQQARLGATVPEAFAEPFPIPPARVTAIVGDSDLMVSSRARASLCALSGSPVVVAGAGHVIGELPQLISERLGV
ncbi:MAG: alpha/beta hydrolase, partial [bacterium]